MERERAALARAQRIRLERQNRAQAGELLERTQVVREGQAMVHAVRARLLAIPPQAVQRGIVSPDRVAALRGLVVDALHEISLWRTVADLERVGEERS